MKCILINGKEQLVNLLKGNYSAAQSNLTSCAAMQQSKLKPSYWFYSDLHHTGLVQVGINPGQGIKAEKGVRILVCAAAANTTPFLALIFLAHLLSILVLSHLLQVPCAHLLVLEGVHGPLVCRPGYLMLAVATPC